MQQQRKRGHLAHIGLICWISQRSAFVMTFSGNNYYYKHSLRVNTPTTMRMNKASSVGGGGPEVPMDQKIAASIMDEIQSGKRIMPDWFYENYQEEVIGEEYEDDDPDAIDPETLGKWDEADLEGNLEYEWDPEKDADPNIQDPKYEYLDTVQVDEEGLEVMYDPIYGPHNPFDDRSIINPPDSYIIDDETRDDSIVTPAFPRGDLEIQFNEDFKNFRKSLKIIETYTDPWLNMEVPRHTSKWYGNPEETSYPDKPDLENQFTKPEVKTDFTQLTPFRARKKAIELARATNNEWLPKGTSEAYHNAKTNIFKEKGILVGSLIRGNVDPQVKSKIQPALDVLGSIAELIEINETVFRFHYHGLIKHKRGMGAWTETLIRDCGVDCTGVVFETGWRKRDPAYDGGDKWFGPY
jgi:hypothetical protein